MNKYIKCFTLEDKDKLINLGFNYMYEQNNVYYFENNIKVSTNFSTENNMDVFLTNVLNF
jgi:hypothetical protein